MYAVTLRKSVMLAIVSSTAFLAVNGVAQAADDVPQVKVNYSDLDLNNSADAKRLYKRLRVAADRVCDTHESRDLRRIAQAQTCVQQALDRAVLDVNHPALLALRTQDGDTRIAQQTHSLQPRS